MTTVEIEKTMANRLEEMREERDEIAAAADRNAAKFTKIARLNREYIEQIKLKDELIESLTKTSQDNNEAAAAKNKQLSEKVQALTGTVKYYRKQLEDQKRQYEKKIRKTKKRRWCAFCFKKG